MVKGNDPPLQSVHWMIKSSGQVIMPNSTYRHERSRLSELENARRRRQISCRQWQHRFLLAYLQVRVTVSLQALHGVGFTQARGAEIEIVATHQQAKASSMVHGVRCWAYPKDVQTELLQVLPLPTSTVNLCFITANLIKLHEIWLVKIPIFNVASDLNST